MLQAIYAVDALNDLYVVVPPDGTLFIPNGQSVRDDRFPLIYEYNGSSTATDDGDNVIKPSSIGSGNPGRYLKRKLDYAQFVNAPVLATVATSGNYSDLAGTPSIPAAQVSSDWNAVSGVAQILNKPTIPTIPARVFNAAPGRALSTTGSNNTFTISATRDADVRYTVNFSAALTLGTSNGQVDLDYSTDSGTTWTNVASISQVFGVSVTITTNQNMVLTGMIPANALVRINRSANTSVTITLTARQQEVLL